MVNWIGLSVQKERYKDFLREAEQDRLIRQVLAGREASDCTTYRALAWLGGCLVKWGKRLQQRYGTASLAPQLIAGHPSQ